MTTEALSEIIVQSLKEPKWDKLRAADRDYGRGHKKAFVNIIPYIGGAAAEELQQYYDYKDDEFFRKFTRFLIGMVETTDDERERFAEDIQKKAEDYSGNVILGMVDRLDNINKETIFANLSVARIKGTISVEDFFRLHSLLERIPYVDLVNLAKYQEDFYDENGDTELLYATGALVQTVIDPNESNKYRLSVLGQKLLIFGMGAEIEVSLHTGTSLPVEAMNKEEIERIIEKNRVKHQPHVEGTTLVLG